MASTASGQAANRTFEQLKREFDRADQADPALLNQLLAQLKIHLSELGLLFPIVDAASSSSSSSSSQHQLDLPGLTTAREVLEIGALHSIRTQDVPSFERYLSLLGTFYNDLGSILPTSANQAPLYALSLLRLLSQNRIAEFHTLLETFTPEMLESTEVAWVLKLERSLMEGSYSRVYTLCSSPSSLPRSEFSTFVSTLLQTVRSEIASCDERAYDSLPLRDAQTLLFFQSESEVKEFAKTRGWTVERGWVKFGTGAGLGSGGMTSEREMNKERVVGSVVQYARELESIV